jgi:argininosuccinate lyase
MVALAEKHADTIVPNYTNGVAAQPNSYGHYLLGHAAGLDRDAQRMREAFARLDRSPMGTTVLNGTSWPLNRNRMASYLGFADTVDNAYDAGPDRSAELPVEVGALVTSIALHAGAFIEDVMTQYAQPRPWILLAEGGGNTYVSSAMPQKRNPGPAQQHAQPGLERDHAGIGPRHPGPQHSAGHADAKSVRDNAAVVTGTIAMLKDWDRILNGHWSSTPPGRWKSSTATGRPRRNWPMC